jgi:hypothetical protein
MVGQRFRRLPGNHGTGAATVEDEARNEPRAEYARLLQDPQDLARRPAVERRGLRGDHDQVGSKQGRAHQRGHTRRPVDQYMVGGASNLRCFTVERIAGKDTEEPGQGFLRTLFGPVEGRALRVSVDDDDAVSVVRPGAGEMER